MSNRIRRQYFDITSLTQSVLDDCADNLECKIELIVIIEASNTTIRASDRNKYVGDDFYEALLNFPSIKRTLGEWLAPNIEFSQLSLELSNADKRFNRYLPGGDEFSSLVGASVEVKLGIDESESTYFSVFKGTITEEAGVARSTSSITIIGRDDYDRLNVDIGLTTFSSNAYPLLNDELQGAIVPIIYGDYTTELGVDPAVVPAFHVNPLAPTSTLNLVVSSNANILLDTSHVYLRRSDVNFVVPASQVTSLNSSNNAFSILQGGLWVNGQAYAFEDGDLFFVRVKGKDLTNDDNIVSQARDLILGHTALTLSDFDSTWTSLETQLSAIKSRIYIGESTNLLNYVLSLFEQVQVEMFISRDLKLSLKSINLSNIDATPTYTLTNWDIVKDTFKPSLNSLNNFNRAQAVYDYSPISRETGKASLIYRNVASFNQVGKYISKQVAFPNLYVASQVNAIIVDMLKLSSAFIEHIDLSVTWRSLLLDVGQVIKVNVDIGGTKFNNVHCLVRDIAYDAKGVSLTLKLWSFQMCPYSTYNANSPGTVGGSNAIITSE